MEIFIKISEQLQAGRVSKVKELVGQALEEGISPRDILEQGLLSGMSIVGEKFKNNQIFVPEVMIAAKAMSAASELLKPILVKEGVVSKGTAVIGTVKGDLHDIGKNLVKMMLEGKGMSVVDLGVDVPAEQFLEKALENNANVICCSALLTTTMNEMKNLVQLAEERGVRNRFKVMVGGAPVTQDFCNSIGADGYAPDAASAADIAVGYCNA